MLQALAGAESLEILVLLKDLSERGLKNLERNVAHAEGTVNATKFGGFSKATKGLKADAEAAAGKRGGGGLGALAGGFLGLPGPIAVAAVAVGGLAALMGATIPVYERVEKQEKALATAAKDHKIALDDLDAHVRASIAVGEQYAFSASDTREAIIKLTSAGLSLAEQQAALPHIMDLARAKHLELAEAARLYELALMGNTRGLKDLGIALPKLTTKVVDHKTAVQDVKLDTEKLRIAEAELKKLQDGHVVTTTKLTEHVDALGVITTKASHSTKGHKATSLELAKAHLRVREAADKLRAAQKLANTTTDTAADKAKRLALLNKDLTGAIGDQKGSVTTLEVAQAKLGDKWERFATKIGPALQSMLQGLVGVLSWLVDTLSTLLDLLGRIPAGIHAVVEANTTAHAQPTVSRGSGFGHHATGGFVGLHGPELTWVGEKGPEYIVPNHQLGSAGGVHLHVHTVWPPTPQQIRQMAAALDHHEYWRGIGAGMSGNRG